MKFAYIIFAHNNFKVLERLVSMLDDTRNDIYVHIDKKVKVLPELSTSDSKLIFIQNRTDVRWGTYSVIKSILLSLKEVRHTGSYDYYHIISGTTLPVKDQDYIHNYFEKQKGSSVFRFRPKDNLESDFKIKRFHFWINGFQDRNKFVRMSTQYFWTLIMKLEKLLNIKINKEEVLYKTELWSSLTQGAVDFILANSNRIKRIYSHSFTGDEYFQLSELNKDKTQKIIDNQYLIFADFEKDHPKNLTYKDFENLKETECLFARKFTDGTI